MANSVSAKSPLSPAVIVAVLVVVVVILGYFGWKAVGGETSSDRVPIDIKKVRENFQQNGIGHH